MHWYSHVGYKVDNPFYREGISHEWGVGTLSCKNILVTKVLKHVLSCNAIQWLKNFGDF